MNKEYNFKVTCRKIESYLPNMDEKLTIKVSHAKFKTMDFYFSLSFDKTVDLIAIKDMAFQIGTSAQDLETKGYLKGFFGFSDDRDIVHAIEGLKKKFNGQECSIDKFDSRWQEFHISFSKWFNNSLRPCLDKELELHKMYFSDNE